MQKKLKVYLVQGWTEYARWLSNIEIVKKVEDADIVIFEGGEDVHPSMYGERAHHPQTAPNLSRDLEELRIYKRAVRLGKHIIGICRGAQFICAMQNRGRLVQHQQNQYTHKIKTFDGKELEINSTHHQAQYPYEMDKEDYKILGWSENISMFHQDGDQRELAPERECEIVHYPKVKGLGIQHHPEMLGVHSDSNIWLRNIVNEFVNNKL